MKRIIAGGLLAAATLLGGLALTNGSAAAVVDENDQPKPLVCYDQTPFQEWKFKKTVTTPAVDEVSHVEYRWDIETRTEKRQPEINKEVKGVIQTYTWRDGWENTGTFDWIDYPGAGPVWDDGRARSGPHNDTFNQSGDTRYRSTHYRYVETGNTRSYNPKQWTAWTPAGSTDWGLSNTPPANTDTTRYVNIQQRTVIDVEYVPAFDTTYFYNGGAVSTTDEDIYGTNDDLDRSWMKFGERTNPGEPFEVPCPTQDPKVDKSFTEWEDGEFDCDDTTVEQTRVKTITTTTYTWNGEGFDEDVTVETKTQTRTRDLTEDEIEPCPTTPPTTEPPVTTAPPTTEPPVVTTTEPPVITTTVPPTVPPTVAPTTPPPPPPPATPTALPETGAETWVIALIAGLLSMAGLGAMRLARRGS